jgi:hypothetical protein
MKAGEVYRKTMPFCWLKLLTGVPGMDALTKFGNMHII